MLCLLALEAMATSSRADPDSDRAAITERLQRWTIAFNTHDAAGICDCPPSGPAGQIELIV
jgi:hypothetical protein